MKIGNKVILLLLAGSLIAAGCSKQAVNNQQPAPKGIQEQNQEHNSSSTPASAPAPAPKPVPPKTTVATSTPAETKKVTDYVKYFGVDGISALELLKAQHKLETKTYSGVGEFVESIDGVKPDSKHFWKFFVNGKSSNV